MTDVGYQVKEYLTTGAGTEGSLLIEKTIHNELIKAVDKKLIPRELAAINVGAGGVKGSSYDIDLETANSATVFQIAEGAAVPISTPTFTSVNVKPAKYGARPLITKEMLEDGKWDLLGFSIERSGKEIAENESSLVITALDGAANTVAGGAAITIANITRAIQHLEDADFTATDMLCGPEVANDLRNIDTFVEADKFGSREMMERGLVGKIYNMNIWVISSSVITSTSAYVFDRTQAYAIVEKRPVTTARFSDMIHDLEGATVTQRLAVSLLRSSAVAKITTS